MEIKKIFSLLIVVGIVVGGIIFITGKQEDTTPTSRDNSSLTTTTADWRSAIFVDIVTGDEFSVDSFKGKPILLESFAVWCPTCLKQQKEIKKLKEQMGDDIIHISLDTDPNEEASQVEDHINRNNFDWLFAISPARVTKSLIDEFGLAFVNAPAAPILLICEDGNTRFLGRGVKDASKLLEEVTRGCEL